jgi:hypothetical protein
MDESVNRYASPIELYFLTCKQELDAITEKHNTLLCRISGVTDLVLQEQLSEEYVIIEEKLSVAQAKFNEAERLLVESLLSDWYGDYLEFYRNQFVNEEPIKCIEKTNNVSILDTAIKMRLRVPTSMKNKRELHLIATTLKKKIKIFSYDGIEIDCIGLNSTDVDNLNIYVNENGESVIPKALYV